IIVPAQPVTLPLVNLQDRAEQDREAQAHHLAREEARRPFDLERGPLFRTSLLRLGEEEHVLLLTVSHIVFDGWSMEIVRHELAVLYRAFSMGQPSPLPELPIQYADFARWQREWLQGARLETQRRYWKQRLGSSPPALNLPT